MKRQITGLHAADRCAADQIPDGVFLVRVQRASFSGRHRSLTTRSLWPFLSPADLPARSFRAALLQPESPVEAELVPARLWLRHRTARSRRGRRSQLVGLKGVVKISHIVINGASLLRLDGFAPAGRWEELSPANLDNPQVA